MLGEGLQRFRVVDGLFGGRVRLGERKLVEEKAKWYRRQREGSVVGERPNTRVTMKVPG